MKTDIHKEIAQMGEDYADGQANAFYTEAFNRDLKKRFPKLFDGGSQDLYVQRFKNGTFGTKIYWSKVDGIDLVKFTQSEQ